MGEYALETILGIVFAILGLALLVRYKRLSSSKYYQYLIIVVAFLFIGFAVYMAFRALGNG